MLLPRAGDSGEQMFLDHVIALEAERVLNAEGMPDRFTFETADASTIVRVIRSAPVTDRTIVAFAVERIHDTDGRG